jgi:enterochelin esterase-like enzyme
MTRIATSVAVLLALGPLALGPLAPGAAAQRSGRVEARTVESASYGRARRVWVYTPPGYDARRPDPYPLLVCFDGADYLGDMRAPAVLDSLVAAGRIPPVVAILVDDSLDRLGDLANHARFATFLGDELLPWARGAWRVTRDPQRTIVTGASAGGLAAAYVAFARPDLFGNVLAQSGAFWRGNEGRSEPAEWLTQQYARAPRKPIRFVLDVGTRELGNHIGAANRRLRDVLRAKGYAVTYTEVPNGEHRPESWRPRLPVGLVALAATWPR